MGGGSASPHPASGVRGAANKAKLGWSSLQLYLHCPPPMMGATSSFKQWVVLGYPALGITDDTADQRGSAPGVAGGDWWEREAPGEDPGTPVG